MSNKLNLSINMQLSFASYQEALSAQLALVRTIEAILEHPVDLSIIKKAFTISSTATDEKDLTYDQWLKEFLKSAKSDKMNNRVLFDFACALCDDIPFGYESSHRIADMLFAYLAKE